MLPLKAQLDVMSETLYYCTYIILHLLFLLMTHIFCFNDSRMKKGVFQHSLVGSEIFSRSSIVIFRTNKLSLIVLYFMGLHLF